MEDSPPPADRTSALPARLATEVAGPEESHALVYTLIALFLLALGFGAWGVWNVMRPAPGDAAGRLQAQQRQIDLLRQKVATLTRSDRISRDANADLQMTLAERDEEIAGLRADVAFYERFVGATGQRRGLTVHELSLRPQDRQVWNFQATLTQNLNKGAVSKGRMRLMVEGMRDGRMQRLDWAALRRQPDAAGVAYSFKYFQQVEGDILLPPGFKPVRVGVRLQPSGGGAAIEHSLPWADAVRPRSGGGATGHR